MSAVSEGQLHTSSAAKTLHETRIFLCFCFIVGVFIQFERLVEGALRQKNQVELTKLDKALASDCNFRHLPVGDAFGNP